MGLLLLWKQVVVTPPPVYHAFQVNPNAARLRFHSFTLHCYTAAGVEGQALQSMIFNWR
jgi:hypothetical protein